jgi:hypothetical protein
MTVHHDTALLWFNRTMAFPLALVALTLFAPLDTLHAQSPSDSALRVGTRVRVSTLQPDSAIGSRRVVGVIRSLAGDSLTVAWENGLRSTIARSRISRLEVSTGPEPYVLRGMGLGFLAGGAIGGVIGAASYEPSTFLDFGIGLHIAAGAIIGGGAGTVLGGIVGAAGRREGWTPIVLGGAAQRVSIAPLLGARARGVQVLMRF